MAIIHRQQDNRSDLQKRISAELTEKAKKKHDPAAELPDGVDDSRYMENTKQTTSLAGIWIAIVVAGVVIAIVYVFASGNRV